VKTGGPGANFKIMLKSGPVDTCVAGGGGVNKAVANSSADGTWTQYRISFTSFGEGSCPFFAAGHLSSTASLSFVFDQAGDSGSLMLDDVGFYFDPSTPTITATQTPSANGSWPVLTNFNGDLLSNNAGGSAGNPNLAINDNDDGCGSSASSASLSRPPTGGPDNSAYGRFDFTVAANASCGYQYAAFVLPMSPARDLSAFTGISLYIRGGAAGLPVKVELKSSMTCPNLKKNKVTATVAVGTGWNLVQIPFTSFNSGLTGCDFWAGGFINAIESVSFSVEPASPPLTSWLGFDEIAFYGGALPSATATPSRTMSPTPQASPSFTRTATPSASPSRTASPTSTRTASPTATRTATGTATRTLTPTPSVSRTATRTASRTATSTVTPVYSPTATPTHTPYAGTPTSTFSFSPTSSASSTPSMTPTATRTASATSTPSMSPTASPSSTPSMSPTLTHSTTATQTASATGTATASASPTPSFTLSGSPSSSPSASATPTQTSTQSPGPALSFTPSVTSSPSPTGAAPAVPASAADGPLEIESLLAVPNPYPQSFMVKLSAPSHGISLKVYSVAYTCVASSRSGPRPAGWSVLDWPAEIRGLPAGLYYVRASLLSQDGGHEAGAVTSKVFLAP
jgi:hypothetical protein